MGISGTTTAANVGIFSMTNLCQAEYLDSRMCTSEEIMKSVNIPELPSDSVAWVQPVITAKYGSILVDISGYKSGQL